MKVELISVFKKQRHLLGYSEDDFRDAVVRPLLLRLGYGDGRDLCGPTEKGKDALFTAAEKIGLQRVIAVQTKKGNLSLAAKAAANIATLVTQIETAFRTPYLCTRERRKLYANQVFICASGTINDSARHHVNEEVKNPNIVFFDRDDLIPLIDKHLPELWLGIDIDIAPYFSAIRKRVVGDSTLPSGTDGPFLSAAASDDLYVPLTLYKNVVRTTRRHGKVTQTPSLEELPLTSLPSEKARRVLLLGDAGSGKSTGMLRLAYLFADKGVGGSENYVIPILLRAQELVTVAEDALIPTLDGLTRAFAHSNKACFTKEDLDAGRVTLLVDSLDEVGKEDERRRVASALLSFSKTYPRSQVILGSRPYRYVFEIPELEAFAQYRVSPMSWRQAEKIVEGIQSRKAVARVAAKASAKELLRRIENLHGLELNPLLVAVFAVTDNYNKQDIPANITELFKKFTELMLGRWDEQKGLKQQYQAGLKDFVLRRLAFEMHSAHVTTVSRQSASDVMRRELALRGFEADIPKLLHELFERSGLLRAVGDDVEFRHHLLQEFFAGRGIENVEFAKTIVCDDWWKRAVVFYFGENPDRIDALKELMLSAADRKGVDVFEAATAIGLALQACYLAPVTDKLAVWRWVVDAISVSRDAVLNEIDDAGERPISAFVTYYLAGRDSVALGNLAQNLAETLAWSQETSGDETLREQRGFWSVAALIESGETQIAVESLKNVQLRDERHLLALHLGSVLVDQIRPAEPSAKVAARQISSLFAPLVVRQRAQLIQEWKSELLEMKEGKVVPATE